MKTRFNKILTLITAVTFAAALTLNIQASLSDPFAGMSDEALAQTTSGVSSEASGGIQFCTAEASPLWGICLPTYDPQNPAFDCIEMGPDCNLCDCDGTYIKKI